MRIFINYALNHAFNTAEKRDKINAINHMIHGGMKSVEAVLFIEAMSQDLADTWQDEKAFCMQRKSTLKCYNVATLSGFRWYEIL